MYALACQSEKVVANAKAKGGRGRESFFLAFTYMHAVGQLPVSLSIIGGARVRTKGVSSGVLEALFTRDIQTRRSEPAKRKISTRS